MRSTYLGAFERPTGVFDDGRTCVVHVVRLAEGEATGEPILAAVFEDGFYHIGRQLPAFYRALRPEDRDWERCSPECEGYAAFDTSRGVRLQRCDECARFESDDDAAAWFVRELERGNRWARQQARELIEWAEHVDAQRAWSETL